VVAQRNAWSPLALGAKMPDFSNANTATTFIREAYKVTTQAQGFGVIMLSPLAGGYYGVTASSMASNGTITWSPVNGQQVPSWSSITSTVFNEFRVIGWGVKLTCEQSLTNAQGHVLVANFPADTTDDPHGWTFAPTTEGGVEALVDCRRISMAQLCEEPIYINAKIQDAGIALYRDATDVSTANFPGSDGWQRVLVYVSGATASAAVLTVEVIFHLEYLPIPNSLVQYSAASCCQYNPELLATASRVSKETPTFLTEKEMDSDQTVVERIGQFAESVADNMEKVMTIIRPAARIARTLGVGTAGHNFPLRITY